jgi:hypothetical protein
VLRTERSVTWERRFRQRARRRDGEVSLPALSFDQLLRRLSMHPGLESRDDCVQSGIVATLRLDFGNRGQNVIQVCPGSAMSLPYQLDLAVEIKASGILDVSAIDHVSERHHLPRRYRSERDPAHGFKVNGGHLFAFAEIEDRGVALGRCYPVGDAAAGAATVQPKHQAGLLWGPAMDEGVYAEAPVKSDEPRRDALEIGKARPPHQ